MTRTMIRVRSKVDKRINEIKKNDGFKSKNEVIEYAIGETFGGVRLFIPVKKNDKK